MLDTLEILDELRLDFEQMQAERLARLMGRIYRELANTVTKADFEELKKVVNRLSDNVETLSEKVNELAEAQKRTEVRLNELAEAQKRTELRVEELAKAQHELAEAQKRTEVRLNELAEAQKRTELRVEELAKAQHELAEAQKRTELRIDDLVKAQSKTEKELKRLAEALTETREHLGGLSDTVGYTLENAAYKALPQLLQRDYGLIVTGRLKRGYIRDRKGRPVEVNIIGEATSNGKKMSILGESKVRLSKKAIRKFIKRRIEAFKGSVDGEIFPVLVTHMISEADAEEFAKEKGIALYYSYDF